MNKDEELKRAWDKGFNDHDLSRSQMVKRAFELFPNDNEKAGEYAEGYECFHKED